MRSTRKQPWCWQEKEVLRYLRNNYSGSELVKLRTLYGALTEIDSDCNGKDIEDYNKTIHNYSGLSIKWIPRGLKELQDMNIIMIIEEESRIDKFKNKIVQYVKFTGEIK